MRKNGKRMVALAAALILFIQPFSNSSMAISGGSALLGEATIDCNPVLGFDHETGQYSLDMELNAQLYKRHENLDATVPARGYFTANYAGWYLVELWGGTGAAGLDDANGTRKGGEGGRGGYVYGKIWLDQEDTLYYSLGGNGRVTYTSGEGGGANGGGGGGASVTYGVGGGGGYSALFLFKDSEYFEENYLDKNREFVGDNISEFDRSTKYVMIAGGGGGGGAANGMSLGGSNTLTADGGAGGSMTSRLSGPVSGMGTAVAGTFYAGEDGDSSGTSDAYIGHGGTTVPGEVASTAWTWSSGEIPNDWTGEYNKTILGGSGGAGNLRGGGGGGGYCGGSGGIQQSLVSPSNVGGGGGGSSFVADVFITNQTSAMNPAPEDGLTASEIALLDGLHAERIPDTGAVAITYLANENEDFANLQNVDVSFTVSKYFNVTGFRFSQSVITGTDQEGNPVSYNFIYNANVDGSTDITIQNVSLIPTKTNLTGKLDISLKFIPKNAFVGGNDVPLLVDGKVTVTELEGGAPQSCDIYMNKNNCYVNVPLKFEVDTKNYSYNSAVSLSPEDMHGGIYNAIRADMAAHPMYDRIADIGEYAVEGMTGETTISETTAFPVSFVVTPKDDVSIEPAAGPETVGQTTFTKDAVVTILERHQGHLNGVTVNFTKALTYHEDGTYLFSINTQASNDRVSHIPNPDTYGADASGGGAYDVEHDGYYLVQAWGGSGRNGQEAIGVVGTFAGGSGGPGGYTYVYLPLKVGDRLVIEQVGTLGVSPDNVGAESNEPVGGGGGTYTLVTVDYKEENYTDENGVLTFPEAHGEILLIAGGGGGGGNGIAGNWIGLLGDSGKNCQDSSEVSSSLDHLSAYNGTAGGVGSQSGLVFTGGSAGQAGKSYFYSEENVPVYNTYESTLLDKITQEIYQDMVGIGESETAVQARTNPSTDGSGAVKISCLQLTDHSHVAEELTAYTLQMVFSDYFEIIPDTLTGQNNSQKAAEETPSQVNLVYTDESAGNQIRLSAIAPYQDGDTTTVGETTTYNSSIDFTITVKLRPKDGFLGGNDVPLFTGGVLYQTIEKDGIPQEGHTAVPSSNAADYANVRLLVTEGELGTLVGNEVHREENQADDVERTEIYTWTNSWTHPGDWTGDFVRKEEILSVQGAEPLADYGPGPWSFSGNTHFIVMAGVSVEEPEKATEGPVAQSVYLTDEAHVYVRPQIIYDLTGLTTSHPLNTGIDPNVDYEAVLTPGKGFELPAYITITYTDGSGDVPFAYDSSTGKINIAAGDIRSMKVKADGVRQQYKIHYVYEVQGSNEPGTYTQTYYYEDPVDPWGYQGENLVGYHFAWRWYTETEEDDVEKDGDVLTSMPARDVYVIGNYSPLTYQLVIEYKLSDGVTDNTVVLPEKHVQDVVYGESFYVTSPAVSGYAAEPLIIAGTVNEELVAGVPDNGHDTPCITKKVTYTPTVNQLRINYIYEDTGQVTVYRENYQSGTSYSVVTPEVVGYTASRSLVEGTMTDEGVVVDVLYSPKTFLVTFDYDEEEGGMCAEDSRTVYYNSAYGYCLTAEGKKFVSLPSQVLKAGSKFVGWYLDPEDPSTLVDNETFVKQTEDHTLYAKWETKTYTLVVEHVYLNGSAAAETEHFEVPYTAPGSGNTYTVQAKEIPGYRSYVLEGNGYAQANFITDEMPAQTVVRTFFYIGETYPLTINYVYFDNEGNIERTEVYTTRDLQDGNQASTRFGDKYSVDSPAAPEGYSCSMPSVSGTLNTLSELDIEDGQIKGRVHYVYYYKQAPVISVSISWGDMRYEYERGAWQPETHSYADGTFSPSAADANKITVTNGADSTISVDASFSYVPRTPYESVEGYFTESNNSAASVVTSVNVEKNSTNGSTKEVWLWLDGRLADSLNGTLSSGSCIVTITGGG